MLQNSFEIDSFIDSHEIEILKKFYGALPKRLNDGVEKKAYTTGFPYNTLPLKKLKAKLKETVTQSFGIQQPSTQKA